jgi:hypothetical protein
MALRAHTYFLSSDLLEGRGTATRGERIAASYLSSQLQQLGLTPAGNRTDYLQPVPLRVADFDDDRTRAVLRAGSDSTTFRSVTDFIVNTGGANAFHDFAGRAVFAGAAPVAARVLAGRTDLRGAVIVVAGTLGASALELIPSWISRSVSGVILLIPDSAQYALYVRSRGEFRYVVASEVNDPVWQPDLPLLIAGPGMSTALLSGIDITHEMVDGKSVFPSLDLGKTLAVSIRTSLVDAPSANVAGMIRGSDPTLRNEIVVYSAHYDHLGISTPDARGDSIYNGFSDNAAGDAMLLAIAKAMRIAPPRRSVLFLFLTGEERGLLGSSYFASHPLVPKERIVADINLDAGAPSGTPLDWRIAGGTSSTLGAVAARVAATHGWKAESTAASPNTDYWPFLRVGVPAIFLVPGGNWEGITTAQREELQRRWDHYHQAADEWSPEFPFRGLQRYAQLALEIGQQVANATEKPRLLHSGDPAIGH